MKNDNLKRTNVNLWITANAGSGKTTQLVNRYIFLLTQNIKPEEIVCITYTNAGADEMKNRILKIAKEKSLKITEKQIRISTIHSFCQRLLQTNNAIKEDIKILTNNEYENSKIVKIISKNIFDLSKTDKYLNRVLQQITEEESIEGFNFLIKNIIEKQNLFLTIFKNNIEFLEKEEYKKNNNIKSLEKLKDLLLRIDINNLKYLMPKAFWGKFSYNEKLHNAGVELQNHLTTYSFEELYKKVCTVVNKNDKNLKFFEENQTEIFKLKNWKNVVLTKQEKTIVKKVFKANDNLLLDIANYFKDVIIQQSLNTSLSVLYFSYNVLLFYKQIKKKLNVITYDDILFDTEQNIANDVLFLNKLNIKHLMLDEAQDTNPISWEIIKKIIKTKKSYFFVVGDQKQSIYSFQGAKISEYEKNRKIFKNISIKNNIEFDDSINLNISYRSTKEILSVADKLCNYSSNIGDLDIKKAFTENNDEIIKHISYENISNDNINKSFKINAINYEGLDFDKLFKEQNEDYEEFSQKDNNIKESNWIDNLQKLYNDNQKREMMSLNIAEKIINYYNNFCLSDIKNNDKKPTISIIYLKSTTQYNFIYNVIKHLIYKTNYIINLSGALKKNHIYFKDILSFFQFSILQNDDINLASLLKSPLFGFTDNIFIKICNNINSKKKDNLCDKLKVLFNSDLVITKAINNLNIFTKLLTITDIIENIQKIIDDFAPTNHNEKRAKEFYLIYISIIKQLAKDYCFDEKTQKFNYKNYDIRNFIQFINENNDNLDKENNNQSQYQFNIGTIHSVKGKEYDIVVLLDFDEEKERSSEKMLFSKNYFWYKNGEYKIEKDNNVELCEFNNEIETQKKQIQIEKWRCLYVAITRAKKQFIYINNVNKNKYGNVMNDIIKDK